MSGDDGLREAITDGLRGSQFLCKITGDRSQVKAVVIADAVLALPEIAALRAKAAAADRVRDEIDALSRETGAFEASYKGWALKVVSAIRRALDGPDPC